MLFACRAQAVAWSTKDDEDVGEGKGEGVTRTNSLSIEARRTGCSQHAARGASMPNEESVVKPSTMRTPIHRGHTTWDVGARQAPVGGEGWEVSVRREHVCLA